MRLTPPEYAGKEAQRMDDATLIKLLALQYIKGKSADSASEYVKLYRAAEKEIRDTYEATKEAFPLKNML